MTINSHLQPYVRVLSEAALRIMSTAGVVVVEAPLGELLAVDARRGDLPPRIPEDRRFLRSGLA